MLLFLIFGINTASSWDYQYINHSAVISEKPNIIYHNVTRGYDEGNRTLANYDTAELYYGFNASGSLKLSDLFNESGLLGIYNASYVSPNGIIARNGTFIQLVDDKNLAGHAGNSTMPLPDGRKGVNHFGFGWRTISLNVTVANKVSNITGKNPSEYEPTDKQYRTIAWLLVTKRISNLVYYNEIKPPGAFPEANINRGKMKEALKLFNLTVKGYNITNIQ